MIEKQKQNRVSSSVEHYREVEKMKFERYTFDLLDHAISLKR